MLSEFELNNTNDVSILFCNAEDPEKTNYKHGCDGCLREGQKSFDVLLDNKEKYAFSKIPAPSSEMNIRVFSFQRLPSTVFSRISWLIDAFYIRKVMHNLNSEFVINDRLVLFVELTKKNEVNIFTNVKQRIHVLSRCVTEADVASREWKTVESLKSIIIVSESNHKKAFVCFWGLWTTVWCVLNVYYARLVDFSNEFSWSWWKVLTLILTWWF
jgi:hypothetical protein